MEAKKSVAMPSFPAYFKLADCPLYVGLHTDQEVDGIGWMVSWKPLAQGRLVNSSTTSNTQTVTSLGSNVLQVPDCSITVSHNSTLPGKKALTPLAKLHARTNQASERREPDTSLTPRRATPNESEIGSPAVSRPIITLDLSDSEQDGTVTHRGMPVRRLAYNHDPPNVLVVDASNKASDPNRSEVDIVLGYELSPIKVVCHSPAVLETTLRDTGDVEQACRVTVDDIPTVHILTDTQYTDSSQPHHHRSPHIVRERTVAGGSIDKRTNVRSVPITSPHQRPIPELPPSPKGYPQPNFDDSLESNGHADDGQHRADGGDESDDRLSVISNISDTSSLREIFGNTTRRSSSSVKADGKRKKKGHVVSSRYMQSANSFKSGTPTKQRSVNISKSVVGSKSRGSQKTSQQNKSTRSKSTKDRCIREKTSSIVKKASVEEIIQQTPVVASSPQSVSGKTSTPTHDEVSFLHNIDTSAIAPTDNVSTFTNSVLTTSVYSNPDVSCLATGRKQEKKSEVSQLYLDSLYARYTHWLYLDAGAMKSLHEQEKSAMAQICSVWEQNEKLCQTETQLKSELQHLRHANLLDEQLELQKSGLGPVLANLPQVGEDHRILAEALDTTRHQIETRGIHLPTDEHLFQESFISALNESDKLLGELSMMTRQHTAKTEEYSKAMSALERAVNSECTLLSECQELLAASQSLATREMSLKIEAIEDKQAS